MSSNSSGRLVKHIFNFGLGNALPRVIGFFLIPVYTFYLSPSDFGIIDLATSLGALLVIVMRLGIPGAVTRIYFDVKEKEELKDFITTIFWFILLSGLVIGIISWFVLQYTIDVLLPGLPLLPFVWMIIFWAFLNSNTDLQRRLIQVREQSAYSAKLSVITSLFTILLTIIFVVKFKLGAFGVILAMLISGGVFFLQAQIYLSKDILGNFKISHLKPSINYALGIFPHQLLSSAAPLISRSILSNYDSLAAVGLLGIGYRFIVPLNLLLGAIQSAFTPIYYSLRIKEERGADEELNKLIGGIFFFGLLIHIFVLCFGGIAIRLITSEEFHYAAALVPGLVLYVFFDFLSALTGNEITFQKKTKYVFIISVVKNVVYILAAIMLVNEFGALGIVYSMVASTVVGFIISFNISRKFAKIFKSTILAFLGFFYLIVSSIILLIYNDLPFYSYLIVSSMIFFVALSVYLFAEMESIKAFITKFKLTKNG